MSLLYWNARNRSPCTKNGRNECKSIGHVANVGDITDHTLHHRDIAIEHASNASTVQPLSVNPQIMRRLAYLMISVTSVRDRPKAMLDALRPSKPIRIMGRRPMTSDI